MEQQTILRVRSYAGPKDSLTLLEISEIVNTPLPMLERMVDEEILRPELQSSDLRFSADQVREVERSLRLHEDLGVNWAGIAIIHHLLDRVESLQQALDRKTWGTGEVRDTSCE